MKSIWKWLSNEHNNKALGSLAYILALAVVLSVAGYLSGFFGSLSIIQYDSEFGILMHNGTNKDIFVIDVTIQSTIDNWSRNQGFYKIIRSDATELIGITRLGTKINREGEQHKFLTIGEVTNEILRESSLERCFFRKVYSKEHPKLTFLINEYGETNQVLYMFDVESTMQYFQGNKHKTAHFDAVAIIIKYKDCVTNN